MEVVLDIDGWRKVGTIDDNQYYRGSFAIGIMEPISFLVQPDTPVRDGAHRLWFYVTNKTVNGMPLCIAEEWHYDRS